MTTKILVVDDNREICRVMADMLGSTGARVLSAYNGAEALGLFDESPPDLAIIDLLLAGAVSSDAIVEHAKLRKCPVITMSGTLSSDRHGREFAHPHLAKPFATHQLLDVVATTLARRGRPAMVL